MADETYSGGCQCGAIRFRVVGKLGDASICHCRMCQKAFGGFFAPLVSIGQAALTWTRGAPSTFASSNAATRGFCSACGTPLSYTAPDGVALAIGAFDEPATIAPIRQWGIEGKLPYCDGLSRLPASGTLEDAAAAPFLATLRSHQHPDHDTPTWPPA
ncbi:MAG: GFA family protein [Hyphomicrobium sp.]